MIIPIRCFTCGKVTGDKWDGYCKIVKEEKQKLGITEDSILNLKSEDVKKTPEGIALDKLGLTRYCCRRILLSHVDLVNII